MPATLRIHPEGEFEVGTLRDNDGGLFVLIDLPDRRSGDRAELVFNLATFVTFADWVEMIARELIAEEQAGKA